MQHQLSDFPELRDRLLGFVLNKADVRVLERYETYYGRYYYRNYGGQYPLCGSGHLGDAAPRADSAPVESPPLVGSRPNWRIFALAESAPTHFGRRGTKIT